MVAACEGVRLNSGGDSKGLFIPSSQLFSWDGHHVVGLIFEILVCILRWGVLVVGSISRFCLLGMNKVRYLMDNK